MSMQTVQISAPDEAMLTPVQRINCLKVAGRWTVTNKLFGTDPRMCAVLGSEDEELLVKARKGLEEEWYSLGTVRGRLDDRVAEFYARYAAGWFTEIAWYKRQLVF